MKIKRTLILTVALGAVLIGLIGCEAEKNSLVPITTCSEEALAAYLTGRDLGEKLRIEEARPYFEKAVELDPKFAMAYLSLAFTEPSTKGFFARLNKAVSLVEKVSEGERLWILGTQAGTNTDRAGEREYDRQLVEMYPDDPRANNLMAGHYFNGQDWELAIEYYDRALLLDSSFSIPYNQIGYAHRFMGDFEKAEQAFKKYLELIPDDPNPYDSYAELLMKMGKYDESIEMYEKALAVNPTFRISHIGVATNLCFKDEYEAARERLRTQMLETAPDNGVRLTAHGAIALTYVYEGRYEEAVNELEKQYALAEEIWDASAMANDLGLMGSIFIEAGAPDKARSVCNKANKLMENSELPKPVKENAKRGYLFNSARISLLKKDLATAKAKAQEYAKQVKALDNPGQIRASHTLMALIALEEKKYGRVIEHLTQANQRDPYTFYRMMLAYQGLNDHERAEEMCRQVVEFNQINSLAYAYVRNKAREILATNYVR